MGPYWCVSHPFGRIFPYSISLQVTTWGISLPQNRLYVRVTSFNWERLIQLSISRHPHLPTLMTLINHVRSFAIDVFYLDSSGRTAVGSFSHRRDTRHSWVHQLRHSDELPRPFYSKIWCETGVYLHVPRDLLGVSPCILSCVSCTAV